MKTVQGLEIGMEYHWDGDGVLRFIMPDRTIENTDCKKSYRWEEVERTA